MRHPADAHAYRRWPVPGQVLPHRDAVHHIDIEIVFLYPWAVTFDSLGIFGLVEMLLLIATLLVAYVYVWRRDGLEWD